MSDIESIANNWLCFVSYIAPECTSLGQRKSNFSNLGLMFGSHFCLFHIDSVQCGTQSNIFQDLTQTCHLIK